jgi:hypothetical protein
MHVQASSDRPNPTPVGRKNETGHRVRDRTQFCADFGEQVRAKRTRVEGQKELWTDRTLGRHSQFWQRRFYDFNVWSKKKQIEKLNYMHFNPVTTGLVTPKEWAWSDYRFYWFGARWQCTPNLKRNSKPRVLTRKRAPFAKAA